MNYRNRNVMITDAKDLNFFENTELDKDDFLINCRNCVLDLSEDQPKVLEHNADLLLSKICNASYNPAATCTLWEKTVNEIMQGDTAKIKYLQKMSGRFLTGDTSEEEFYIFFGATTRNGKSTITEILLYLLGDYATTISPESLAIKANKDSRTASPDIAKLAGTRLVVASEPPRRMLFDSSLVKTLTGRDTVSARFLHENEFQFKPKFKLILNSNYLPVISDKTVFSSNRVKVVPFERHFTEKEQNKTNNYQQNHLRNNEILPVIYILPSNLTTVVVHVYHSLRHFPYRDMIFNGNNPILLLFYTGNRIISFGFVFQIFCYC